MKVFPNLHTLGLSQHRLRPFIHRHQKGSGAQSPRHRTLGGKAELSLTEPHRPTSKTHLRFSLLCTAACGKYVWTSSTKKGAMSASHGNQLCCLSGCLIFDSWAMELTNCDNSIPNTVVLWKPWAPWSLQAQNHGLLHKNAWFSRALPD